MFEAKRMLEQWKHVNIPGVNRPVSSLSPIISTKFDGNTPTLPFSDPSHQLPSSSSWKYEFCLKTCTCISKYTYEYTDSLLGPLLLRPEKNCKRQHPTLVSPCYLAPQYYLQTRQTNRSVYVVTVAFDMSMEETFNKHYKFAIGSHAYILNVVKKIVTQIRTSS